MYVNRNSNVGYRIRERLGPVLNVSNCENNSYTTFGSATPTGFNATSNGGGNQYAGTADECLILVGMKVKVSFDLVLNSGTVPYFNLVKAVAGTSASSGGQTTVAGSNVFRFTSTYSGLGAVQFYNIAAAANYEITNLSVRQIL